MSTLYLCGASNPEGVRLALRVNATLERWTQVVLVDDDLKREGQVILGVPVIGQFSRLSEADPETDHVVNLVARTTTRRLAAGERIAAFGLPFAGLVHPDVDVDGASLAPDTIVYPRATIGPLTTVGEGSVVFMGAIVGHGSRVGAYCVVAPNAVVNARVVVGDRTYIGTNASVLPDLRIGDDATIAANSAVMSHVRAGVTMLGVPAKALPLPPTQRPPGAATSAPLPVLTTRQ